jgi:predicted small lipoprotein YifL
MKRRFLPVLAILCLAALAAGCAKGNVATPGQDAQARLLESVPDKAVIYLLRDLGDIYITEVKVGLDGQLMGTTSHNTFYRWEVPAGMHVIVSYTQPPAVLTLKTEPGGVYYVWQDINVGLLREPSRLQVVDATTARLTMDQARLLQNEPPAPATAAAQ